MKLRPLSAAVLLAISGFALTAQADNVRRPYIIQLADQPVASYDGAVTGLSATRPASGKRLALDSSSVRLYSGYLDQKKAAVRSAVGNAPVLHDYKLVLNGFAAMLTDAEVRTLMARGDVVSVTLDTPRELTTTYTPAFLGLDQPNGAWAQLGGLDDAGEDIIIGIVDGGVWPENPAYADRVDANGKPTFSDSGTLAYDAPPARFSGDCQTGEGFTTANCNNKLIGAHYFDSGFKASGRVPHWSEFNSSPRDSIGGTAGEGGHGTHVSTTAGGNHGVDVTVGGVNVGVMSGIAPRARISSYKVCWTYVDPSVAIGRRNSCYGSDSVAAIEKAVADGVHVINYSISGGLTLTDSVEQAFFNASNAGVVAVASAGNDGPGNQVAHISPWHTTVAASTHNRELQAKVTLGNNRQYTGASMNPTPLPDAPLVDAANVALPGANPQRVSYCYSGQFDGGAAVLDPAKVAGKIVICNRGLNDRVDKSRAVLEAGGIGMIQVDNGTGLVADLHSVPSVHVTAQDGQAIRAYAASVSGATAAIGKFSIGTSAVAAPMMASFSSRGPNRHDVNVLKPDLTAPGVDIIAGTSPAQTEAQRADIINGTLVPEYAFESLNGTSMSAPHVSGLSALLRQKYPNWSPSMIKSALMTTATDTFDDGQPGDMNGLLPFAQGAGHVNPTAALNPGLVYGISELDYRKYMCGAGVSAQCSAGQIAGYDLNLPSITVGNVLGTVTVNRSVTNVGSTPATYTAETQMQGFSAVVAPASLQLAPGETKSFTVTLTRGTAAENAWQYGHLTWSDGVHRVRSPIAARSGRPLIAPTLVSSDRPSGAKPMSVSTGFSGKMTSVVGGLKEIVRTPYTLAPAVPGSVDNVALMASACLRGATGTRMQTVTFTADTMAALFETFDRDTSGQGGDDFDLVLLNSTGTPVASSATFGSTETIALLAPAPGTYRLCTIAYSTADGQPSNYGLHSVIVNTSDKGGNLRAAVPATVYAGGKATVPVSWSGLPTGKRFLGAVRLLDNNGAVGSTTVVQVETNQPVPQGERPQRDKFKNGKI